MHQGEEGELSYYFQSGSKTCWDRRLAGSKWLIVNAEAIVLD